jgi:hypothetical protein
MELNTNEEVIIKITKDGYTIQTNGLLYSQKRLSKSAVQPSHDIEEIYNEIPHWLASGLDDMIGGSIDDMQDILYSVEVEKDQDLINYKA